MHDLAHGSGEVARFVGISDARRGGLKGCPEFRLGVGVDHHAAVALVDEAGATTGDVDHLADQVGVDLLHEVLEVQIEVVDATAELGRIVVAQILRVQVFEIGARLDESTARLGHLLPVHRQVTMHVHRGRLAEARAVQHGRPEQGVEVDDVLADEVIQLCARVLAPKGVKRKLGTTLAEIPEARHVADRCIQPDVEVLARLVGDLEAEIGGVAGDVPFLQATIEPLGDLVGHGLLQRAAAGPFLEHRLEVGQLEEEVLGVLEHRGGAGDRRARVFQLGGLVGGAAFLAVVAILVLGTAFGAAALDEAVGEEHALLGIEVLSHRAGGDVPGVAQTGVDQLGQLAVLFRVGAVEVVEVDEEVGKVTTVFGLHVGDQLFGGDAFLLGA